MPYSSDDARQKVYQEKPVSSVFVPGTELQEVVQFQCLANSRLPSSFLFPLARMPDNLCFLCSRNEWISVSTLDKSVVTKSA